MSDVATVYFEILAAVAALACVAAAVALWRLLGLATALAARLGRLLGALESGAQPLLAGLRTLSEGAYKEGGDASASARGVDRFGRITGLSVSPAGRPWTGLAEAAADWFRRQGAGH